MIPGKGFRAHQKHISPPPRFPTGRGTYEETTERAVKRVLAHQLTEAMKAQKISKVEMARRLNTNRSQLDRLLDASEAIFVFMQRARELDPHDDLKSELLSRQVQEGMNRATISEEEIHANIEAAARRRTEPAVWKKIENGRSSRSKWMAKTEGQGGPANPTLCAIVEDLVGQTSGRA